MQKLSGICLAIIFHATVFAQGNVGIGTVTPQAALHVNDGSVIFSSSGSIPGADMPTLSYGLHMLWYANRGALRSGNVTNDYWDQANVGFFSFAAGRNVKAAGNSSIAMGENSVASNDYAVAIGRGCTSSQRSISIGQNAEALGSPGMALGFDVKSIGTQSVSLGSNLVSNNSYSIAIGHFSTASGWEAIVAGNYAVASGQRSVALGNYVNTNLKTGALIIGDNSTAVTLLSSLDNHATMRFANGYKLYTNSAATIGAQLTPGANAWSTISDKNKKENFVPVNGESTLNNISKMQLTTWNYKGQDSKLFRHYGPMAQDFFEAFGKDAMGISGCDTLINQADFEGINLVAIQGLIKRTEVLQQKLELMEKQMAMLVNENEKLHLANRQK